MGLESRTLVQSREQMDDLLAALDRHTIFAFDTETAKTENWSRRYLLGIAFTVYEDLSYKSWYLPIQHKHKENENTKYVPNENLPWDWWLEAGRYLSVSDKEKIAHNKKFDCEICERNGAPVRGFVHDTQVGFHLVDENQFSYELDYIGNSLFGQRKVNLDSVEKQVGWECIPPYLMGEYAMVDTEITFRIYHHILPRLEAEGLLKKAYPIAMRFGVTLQHMVECGLYLDVEKAKQLSSSAVEEMWAIEEKLGWRPSKRNDLIKRLHGVKQLALPVTRKPDIFKNGVRVKGGIDTGVETITRLQARFSDRLEVVQELDDILRYRTLQKANSTWFEGFQRYVDDQGRIHPGLKQHGTETGRLSCAQPNTQQLPRDESLGVKGLFQTPEGYELWEYDFSQIELRIACARAQDKKMMDAYRNGDDLHHMTAELIGSYDFFPNDKDGKANGRQVGKRGNFLWIYRGSGNRLRIALWGDAKMDVPLSQCNEWTREFHRAYPSFNKYAERLERIARRDGYITLFNGRRRRFVGQKARDAFNALVQGEAAVILQIGANEIDKHPGIKSRLCNTVHDSLWVLHSSDSLEEESELIKECMVTKPTKLYGIPFIVDSKRIA